MANFAGSLGGASTSFLVAGGMGVLANYAIFSQYTPASMDLMLKELSAIVAPLASLKAVLPALFGFLGGTFLLLVWNYLSSRAIRFLLEYDNWFLKPKQPINKLWFLLMSILLGKKNRGLGKYQDVLPSLPVPSLEKTAKKYLNSVQPLLSADEFKDTQKAVAKFVKQDGKKLQWYLKFRSWKSRNWMADWWIDFVYLRQRTPICFNSNYYALCQYQYPSHRQLDRAATVIHLQGQLSTLTSTGTIENAMATPFAPFCASSYKYLHCTARVPGEEQDKIVAHHSEKPIHGVIYCKGRYYQIEVLSPTTGKPHSPITIKQQLEKVVAMAPDVRDEQGVQNLTSLPRSRWAKVRATMETSPVNRRSLHAIDSAFTFVVLEDSAPEEDDLTAQARTMFHGDGYSRWFDKSVTMIVCANGALGANVEHTPLDATICGHLWEFILTREKYDSDERCLELYPGEKPVDTPTPSQLKWELSEVEEDISAATSSLAIMIQDSDLLSRTMGYGKAVPKKFKLSPDGWFQMAIQLAYYRLHHKFVLTYESATTRLFYQGRTETIRPVSQHSCDFVTSFDDDTVPRDKVKQHLRNAIEYQQSYKMEAMRGLGVDRHLFGLYIAAKGMKMDPLPDIFEDKAFNFSFELSTSQTPVKTTNRWTLETSTTTGGFGTVCDNGYGISYIVVGEDTVNLSIHSKRSCPDTSSQKMADTLYQTFEDMRALFLN